MLREKEHEEQKELRTHSKPQEPLNQYRTAQLRHFLREHRCLLSGSKKCLMDRLRMILQELRQYPGLPICSQLQCYRRQELQKYLRQRDADTKGSKKDMKEG